MATNTQTDVVMPQMGVSVSEGTVTKWLKQEGETVAPDEALLEISTDKVDTEVPSPGGGVLAKILVPEGETVEVGTVLAVIAPEGAAAPPADMPPAPATQEAADQAMAAASEGVGDVAQAAEPAPAPPAPAPAAAPRAPHPCGGAGGRRRERQDVPLAGRRAHRVGARRRREPCPGHRHRRPRDEEGHPGLRRVRRRGATARSPGSGAGPGAPGRARAIAARARCAGTCCRGAAASACRAGRARAGPARTGPAAPAPAAPAPAPAAQPAPVPVASAEAQPGETIEPMNAMRKGIAEHMRRSLDTSAHVTSAIEVDMSKVVDIRERLKKDFESSYGVKLTYLAFVARAAVETLREYPWINGEIRGDKIVTRNYVNLGFAVELADGKGLIVPVVKNTEGLNLLGMARSIVDIAAKARDKKLMPDDVQGGTFTITNPGGYGTFHGTPVISQPQAGILGTYAVVKRPWVVSDELGQDVIAIRPIMNLTLTYDHRLVDGALAGRFLRDLRKRLESWGESDY